MLQALKVGLLIERSNRKNIVALLAVIVIVFGCMFFIKAQSVGDQLNEKRGDYYSSRAVLAKFQVQDASRDGDGSDLFKNLTQQKSAVALQIASLTVENYPMYYEASYRIAELRQQAFDMDEYEKVKDLLPTKFQNSMNYLYFRTMYESGKNMISDISHYIPFLMYFFSLIGVGWYIFISFYTSLILLDDFEHSSMIKGYPVRFDHYVISKCIIAFLYVIAFIVLIFISAAPLLFNGLGDSSEKVAVYLGEPALISSVQYIVLCIVYMLVISIFVMLLSIILNVLLKNMYLTLFVHFILFFLPVIFPSIISVFPYNPFHFMNFNEILNGMPLDLVRPVNVTMNIGLLIMSICILIMLFVIKTFFSTGKIKRA
ncbi:ABC transporter [Solibacillus sp. FSL W7-1436]|uniref:ABC transporter n=1 Tax=Solibacillus sp. FSL W7-1436 TaxID=2921705 RepID=UPI0030FCCAEB